MKRSTTLAIIVVFVFLFTLNKISFAQTSARETPIVKVVKENANSVVNISTEHILYLRDNPYWGSYGNEFDMFFGQFFGFQQPTRALKLKSVGSGVIIDKYGLIITNAHVIHMASNIYVILNNGTQLQAQTVYENLKEDLAVIKVQSDKELKPVKLGNSDDIMIGETVIAIGNPLGLENSVTSGIISGTNRELVADSGHFIGEGLIQTDAPINPGNSGGALLNLDGELIGINVAVVQNSQSIGFAIPVSKVKIALNTYKNNKGISVKSMGPNTAKTPSPGIQQPNTNQQQRWNPYQEIDRMREEMDRVFNESLNQMNIPFGAGIFDSNLSFNPDIDMQEEKDKYIIKMNIEGLNKDKINIDINQNSLTLKGEKESSSEETSQNKSFQSKSYSSFMRTIPVPADSDTTNVNTEIKDNILTITIPKK